MLRKIQAQSFQDMRVPRMYEMRTPVVMTMTPVAARGPLTPGEQTSHTYTGCTVPSTPMPSPVSTRPAYSMAASWAMASTHQPVMLGTTDSSTAPGNTQPWPQLYNSSPSPFLPIPDARRPPIMAPPTWPTETRLTIQETSVTPTGILTPASLPSLHAVTFFSCGMRIEL